MKFFDLGSQQELIKQRINQRMADVLEHGKYILGPEVFELEQQLAEYTGAKYCITCANGTDALQIALMSIGIGPGDEVITPAFSYIATAEATRLLGANPVYVDVDPMTFNINPDLIEEKITTRTKAIIPVSLYGQPANFSSINRIAKAHKLMVIEDGAQSFGATFYGQKSCNLSDIACTSFFPTKPLGCYGDGGAIFTSDADLAETIRKIARHGQSRRYHHEILGVNSRLDTLQAAIILEKLKILDEEIQQRDRIAKYLCASLIEPNVLTTPKIRPNIQSAWAQFTVVAKNRVNLQTYLSERGIPTAIHYPVPLYLQPAMGHRDLGLVNANSLAKSVLSLPVHAYLKPDEIEQIIVTVNKFYE